MEDLRKQMIVTNETGFRFYGLSSDNMNLVVTYAESLRDGTNVMPLNDASRKLLAELEGIFICFCYRKLQLRNLKVASTKCD